MRLVEVMWYRKNTKSVIEIEGLGDMKLSGYIAVYREDMAMVMALVKFLVYNMYVVYSCFIFSHSYLIFLSLLFVTPAPIFETPPNSFDILLMLW